MSSKCGAISPQRTIEKSKKMSNLATCCVGILQMMRFSSLLFSLGLAVAASSQLSAQVFDDFETYSLAYGGADTLGVYTLDSTTVTGTGQGPGLVAPGCSYDSQLGLSWYGNGYYGFQSQMIGGGHENFYIHYATPVTSIRFDVHTFTGYPDSVLIELVDPAGVVFKTDNIYVTDTMPWYYSFEGRTVKTVNITSLFYTFSPIIDNHEYNDGAFQLSVHDVCMGVGDIDIYNATPGGLIAFVYGSPGPYTITSGPCTGTTLGISNPTLSPSMPHADAAGTFHTTYTIPISLCGQHLQAIDVASCTASNLGLM
jgi:hypothetical protein